MDIRLQKVISAKKSCIAFREDGMDLKDCALMCGYALGTIKNWQAEDEQFMNDMAAARARYKQKLIKKVTDKDPKYLLQNDFPERFKKDKEVEQPNNTAVFVGYDKLAQQLAEFLSGASTGSSPTTLIGTPETTESRTD